MSRRRLRRPLLLHSLPLSQPNSMPHLSADAKHAILLEYSPRSATHSFAALAQRHGVEGGWRVVKRWHERWDATARSLEEKPRSGRPHTLSSAQVQQHVRAPILAANREHRAISYTQLLPSVQRATGTELTLRTLQRYGKKELGARNKHTTKRTRDERQCNAAGRRGVAALLPLLRSHPRALCCSVC